MTQTQTLLAEYAANGSETAFRQLVALYIDFVHSTARRVVGQDAHLADDVTQLVFINLAKKGRSLSSGVSLGSWLHQHTFHVATKAVRTERRRQSREREAMEMNMLQDNDSESNMRRIEPVLDDAINQLGSEDRTAILLRFFERQDFRSVGEALGSKENTARMRVSRALEKLQILLKERGVTLSTAAIAAALASGSVSAAPAGMALTTADHALAKFTANTSGTYMLTRLVSSPGTKLALLTLLIVGGAATAVVYRGTPIKDQASNRALLNNPSDARDPSVSQPATPRPARLPRRSPGAAVAPVTAEPAEPTGISPSLASKTVKLTTAEVEPYLSLKGRTADTLLAAFRTTDNPAFLEEAMQKFPNDPHVAFEAALPQDIGDRRLALNAFKAAAPENALANYLSAADHLKNGQNDVAIQELVAADGKPQFQDYSSERAQVDEDAYAAAGRPAGEAKLAATYNLLLPHLAQLNGLGRSVVDLANSYAQSGDESSRLNALKMAWNLGRRLDDETAPTSMINRLVGISVERAALDAMDPNALLDATQQTVQDRITRLTQERASMRELNQRAAPLWDRMSDQDWATYMDHVRGVGEQRALTALVNNYGQQ